MIQALKNWCIFAAASIILSAQSHAAKPALQLKPSSAWEMHYGDDSCDLARQFGSGDDTVLLVFRRYQPTEAFYMDFIGKPLKTTALNGVAKVRFGPVEQVQELKFVSGNLNKDRPGIFFPRANRIAPSAAKELQQNYSSDNDLPLIGPEREAATKQLMIDRPLSRQIILETGSLGKPMASLRQCTDNLAAGWGIDVAKHAKLSRSAAPTKSPATWIESSDYPSNMWFQGKRSSVRFRLMIDTAGTPSACSIQGSNRLKEFDDLVCKALMKRARFLPALAENGEAIASYWASSVFFTMAEF